MENSSFDLRNILGLLRRQLRLIAITMLVIVTTASVTIFSLTPVFTASTLILVDPSRKNLLEPDTPISSSGDSARIDSEVEILRSNSVLLSVAQSKNLVADPEFGVSLSTRARLLAFLRISQPTLPTGEQALNQTLSKLRNAITVQRRGLTYLISVQVRSESPQTAADLANAVAEAYINEQLASKINNTLASRDILQSRVEQARQAILETESTFDSFIQSNIDEIVRDTGRTDLAAMQAQIADLQSARSQSLSAATLAQQRLEAGDYGAVVSSLQSDALAELERQRAELAAAVSRSGAESPALTDLRGQLSAIEDRLRDQAQLEVSSLRSSVAETDIQVDGLRQSIRSAVLQTELSADTLTQLYALQQNAELARAQYQTLLARVNDLEAQAALQVADGRVVSAATPPPGASFPNTSFLLGISLLTAFAIGVGLAFLYENYLGGITSDAQLETLVHLPVASTVPRTRAKGNSESALADMMVDAPLSVFAESVRRIRASINHTLRDRDDKAREGIVIMVSSTAPGEGKTTMALSIARSYMLSGQSTLLIDADLRKPSIHRLLGIERTKGLLEYLEAGNNMVEDLSTLLVKDTMTDLTILPGARRSGVPTDQLVSSKTFQRLVKAATRSADVIVIDTSPIAPVVDGQYIAGLADVIVYVVRWAATSQSDLREAINTIQTAKRPETPVLMVLNQQDGSQKAYRSKYGEYYAQYE